ncbi:hypothetical protein HAP48_0023060 [Bradyrhizobium septentrionale]|uniref:Uncharacterized protein n=1 Tax=Bradyrhizobium septentrionale TaxID=1404411 RepID=A0A973VWU7_9BRAD|nr:hypothetical protein [Bradyrhizobium septentrionale]UGY20093.1 hypothetical protein HAP48_0023060 [Bradyrhizobium septentrionale]UGY28947.1 hypothetical protein HU675_0020460 [Bradyrhizobium septentrionale]
MSIQSFQYPMPWLSVSRLRRRKSDPQGERLALIGVQAAAEGVGSPDSDQVQFWSEIPDRPLISQLSGKEGIHA